MTFNLVSDSTVTVGLSADNISESGTPSTAKVPVIVGVVAGNRPNIIVEINEERSADNDAVDGVAYTDDNGDFSYTVQNIPSTHDVKIKARVKEWNAVQGTFVYGEWTDFEFLLDSGYTAIEASDSVKATDAAIEQALHTSIHTLWGTDDGSTIALGNGTYSPMSQATFASLNDNAAPTSTLSLSSYKPSTTSNSYSTSGNAFTIDNTDGSSITITPVSDDSGGHYGYSMSINNDGASFSENIWYSYTYHYHSSVTVGATTTSIDIDGTYSFTYVVTSDNAHSDGYTASIDETMS